MIKTSVMRDTQYHTIQGNDGRTYVLLADVPVLVIEPTTTSPDKLKVGDIVTGEGFGTGAIHQGQVMAISNDVVGERSVSSINVEGSERVVWTDTLEKVNL